MILKICDNAEQMGYLAALEVAKTLNEKKNSVLILPTGSTPLPVYKNIAEMYERGEVSFKDAVTFNLDEYIGISEEHPERYYNFMMKNLFSKVDMKAENINIPDSKTSDPEKECVRYEEKYKNAGCADIAMLGIGQNGHIGFNEPGTPFTSVTHVTDITESTVKANARFFENEDQVPKKAMTMGISTILSAKKILLLITGKSKHEILMRLLKQSSADEGIPASVLLEHENTVIYADREAING